MTPSTNELDQLKKQNALLLRTLMRVQRERDALRTQLAAIQYRSQPPMNLESQREE